MSRREEQDEAASVDTVHRGDSDGGTLSGGTFGGLRRLFEEDDSDHCRAKHPDDRRAKHPGDRWAKHAGLGNDGRADGLQFQRRCSDDGWRLILASNHPVRPA
jgi:hypothetical protein